MEFLAAIDEEILACRVELLQAEGAAPAQKTLQELLIEQDADINIASNANNRTKSRDAAKARIDNRFTAIAALDPNGRARLGLILQKAFDEQNKIVKALRKRKRELATTPKNKYNFRGIEDSINANINELREAEIKLDKAEDKLKFFQKLKPPDIKAPPPK
jgi:hypothetical protein